MSLLKLSKYSKSSNVASTVQILSSTKVFYNLNKIKISYKPTMENTVDEKREVQ